jgi:hypothetical protein
LADISASNWNETDASNTTAAPDGAPEGMAPSGVNDVLRAHQGAIKRWYDWTIPKTTAGTSTAYTLSYTVAPGALVDGMTHLVQFNATCGASPTLNVNSLGAKPLHIFAGGTWAAVPSGAITANMICEVAYNSAAGTYRLVSAPAVLPSAITNSLSGDVSLNDTSLYFDGPTVAQGTVGTWFVSGTVSFTNGTTAGLLFKLWDGTTVIASTGGRVTVNAGLFSVSLSGVITNPAGNLRISAKDPGTTSSALTFNTTGTGNDSTITAFRIA